MVAPGFIDLHSHAQYAFGYDQQAHDGVTTALELEEGVYPIAPFYAVRAGKTRINFGASVGLQSIRVKIKDRDRRGRQSGRALQHLGQDPAAQGGMGRAAAIRAERRREQPMFAEGFAAGELGLGRAVGIPARRRARRDLSADETGRRPACPGVRACADGGNRRCRQSDDQTVRELVADAAATGRRSISAISAPRRSARWTWCWT